MKLLFQLVGVSLARILLKAFFKDAGDIAGDELGDIAKRWLQDFALQREVVRQFEGLGDRVCRSLLPAFEAESAKHLNIDAVIHAVNETLKSKVDARFFVEHALDPERLYNAVQSTREPLIGLSAAEMALHDRAIQQAIRYVVEIASQLPKFNSRWPQASLQQLSRIGSIVEETLEIAQRIEMHIVAAQGDPAQDQLRYETDFRHAVVRRFDHVELFGADISVEARRHSLSVAYVSLSVAQQLERTKSRVPQRPALASVEQLLDSLQPEHGRILLRGEAGSGKSTVFRWIAVKSASSYDDGSQAEPKHLVRRTVRSRTHPKINPYRLWRNRIPLLLRLRDCTAGLPAPDDLVSKIARELRRPPDGWVINILKSGKAIVLLDGVDEVPEHRRSTIRDDIEAFISAYPSAYYLLSTRPRAVPASWLADLGFREAVLNPMSRVDIEGFIKSWHDAVRQQAERFGKPLSDQENIAQDLISQLTFNPSIVRLAANPLLCAMICALHRDRNQRLPESQHELCEDLCRMLLHRRELESGIDLSEFPTEYRTLTYEDKRALVQDIAHFMVKNEKSSLALRQVTTCIERTLKGFPAKSEFSPDLVCRALLERTGILREVLPDTVDFIHNTFKEFLAADLFAQLGDAGLLSSRAHDAAWQPVVVFAAASRTRGFATELVNELLSAAKNTPRPSFGKGSRQIRQATAKPGRSTNKVTGDDGHPSAEERDVARLYHALAVQCRAVATHLNPETDEKLQAVAKTICPPTNIEEAKALATLGNTSVPHLRAVPGMPTKVAVASILTLRLIGTKEARRCLMSYADDERPEVGAELVQSINPLELAYVQKMIQGAELPDVIARQIVDVSPLATMTHLQSVALVGTNVTDISALGSLTNLRSVSLWRSPISDISPLANCKRLESLYLGGTKVADLRPLEGLVELRRLALWGTPVVNISPLMALPALNQLDLTNTRVTDAAAIQRLRDKGCAVTTG